MKARELRELVKGVKESGDGFVGLCPAHEDDRASLSFRDGDGKILLKCHAGCTFEEIVAALELKKNNLLHDSSIGAGPPAEKSHIVATYDYKDEAGCLLFQAVRYEPKNFRQRRPDPDKPGKWIWNLKGVRRILYHLPEIQGKSTVYLVEGEKDADRLWSIGIPATTCPMGAGKWRKEFVQLLKEAGVESVVVLSHNDGPGMKHAAEVANSLFKAGLAVKIVCLPDLPEGGDVSDWLDGRGTREILAEIVTDTPILLVPAKGPAEENSEAKIKKGKKDKSEGGKVSQADQIINLVEGSDVVLFHDEKSTAYAQFPVSDHKEIWPLRSRSFRRWLARLMWMRERKSPSSEAIQSALNVLEAKAIFDGSEHLLSVRIARKEGEIWIDLTDESWRAIRINSKEWEVVENPPIIFRRFAHQKPLPLPERGGDPKKLFDFLPSYQEKDKLLLIAFCVVALIPDIPHPSLVIHGPQGSAKSTTLKILKSLFDPSVADLLAASKNLQEFIQTASHHWFLFLDNLSSMPDWLSDALCRCVTGGGLFETGALYG